MSDQNHSTPGQPTENDVRMQRNMLVYLGCLVFGALTVVLLSVAMFFGFIAFMESRRPGRDPSPPSSPFLAPHR